LKTLVGDSIELSLYNIVELQSIFHKYKKQSWAYFVPFLLSYNLPPYRKIYIYSELNAFFIYQITLNDNTYRMDLVFPPLGLTYSSFDLFKKIANNLRQKSLRILWLDSQDRLFFKSIKSKSLNISVKDNEYIYDPKGLHALQGHKYKDVRKKINSVKRKSPMFYVLEEKDVLNALSLLKEWRKLQGRKNGFLLDWGYTVSALKQMMFFEKTDLSAYGVSIDGELKAFAMVGPIDECTASFFVAKSDTRIKGLSEFLRWRICGELQDYSFINDAGDLGLSGLRQYKTKLRPIRRNLVYSATFII
jgi:hypothetical protein